ncbi:MAG TPA: hypothetical protein VGI56_06960 [Galbitalea sp.]
MKSLTATYAASTLALAILVGIAFSHLDVGPRWDITSVPPTGSFTYVAMAHAPFWSDSAPYEAPYCWRLLGPTLLHFWPYDLPTGFFLLASVSLFGTTLAVGWLLLGLGSSRFSAGAGAVCFVLLGPGAAFNLKHYHLIDPLAFFFLTLTLGAVAHRKGLLAAVCLIALAATKETVVIAFASSCALAVRGQDAGTKRWVLSGGVVALVLLEFIRLTVPATEHYSLFHEFSAIYLSHPSLRDLTRIALGATGLTWGILLPFSALQLVHPPRIWSNLGLLTLIVLATAQIFVAWDTERVVILGFPAVIAATTFEVEFIASSTAIKKEAIWIVIFLCELPGLVGNLEERGIPFLGEASALLVLLSCLAVGAALVRSRRIGQASAF